MIQDKLEKIIVLFKERHIELNPPTMLETVLQIEAQYHITLPQEYVSFITTVGNGGLLLDSSGLKQQSCYLYPIEQCNFEKAAIPFPYTEAWDWGHDKTYDNTADIEGRIASTQYGHFVFTEPDDGEGYTWHLIVTWPRSGEVWEFADWKMCRGKSVDFLDWVLDCVERGFDCERYIDPEDDRISDLDIRFEKILKKLKREKLILNPVIDKRQLLAIEREVGIELPKEYATYLTKIGNGFAPDKGIPGKFIYPFEHNDFMRLSRPFPLENTWHFITSQCRDSQTDESYNISVDAEGLWDNIQCGYIILSVEQKRNLPIKNAFLLITTGARAGEIWCLFYYTAQGRGYFTQLGKMSFVDWLDKYLDGFSF